MPLPRREVHLHIEPLGRVRLEETEREEALLLDQLPGVIRVNHNGHDVAEGLSAPVRGDPGHADVTGARGAVVPYVREEKERKPLCRR